MRASLRPRRSWRFSERPVALAAKRLDPARSGSVWPSSSMMRSSPVRRVRSLCPRLQHTSATTPIASRTQAAHLATWCSKHLFVVMRRIAAAITCSDKSRTLLNCRQHTAPPTFMCNFFPVEFHACSNHPARAGGRAARACTRPCRSSAMTSPCTCAAASGWCGGHAVTHCAARSSRSRRTARTRESRCRACRRSRGAPPRSARRDRTGAQTTTRGRWWRRPSSWCSSQCTVRLAHPAASHTMHSFAPATSSTNAKSSRSTLGVARRAP